MRFSEKEVFCSSLGEVLNCESFYNFIVLGVGGEVRGCNFFEYSENFLSFVPWFLIF